jgi:hypothetical protein
MVTSAAIFQPIHNAASPRARKVAEVAYIEDHVFVGRL